MPTTQRRLGRSPYTRIAPAVYDAYVHGFSNGLVWHCPTSLLLAHYRSHLSTSHLEVAVGTGYLLEHAPLPGEMRRLALLDLHPGSAAGAARRLGAFRPEQYAANVLEPIAGVTGTFDSIGMNYLLHCLPGPVDRKARAFDNLAPLLAPGGTIFGATLLGTGTRRSQPGRMLMAAYNRTGIFDNAEDAAPALRHALEARFDDVRLETVGWAALFSARRAADR